MAEHPVAGQHADVHGGARAFVAASAKSARHFFACFFMRSEFDVTAPLCSCTYTRAAIVNFVRWISPPCTRRSPRGRRWRCAAGHRSEPAHRDRLADRRPHACGHRWRLDGAHRGAAHMHTSMRCAPACIRRAPPMGSCAPRTSASLARAPAHARRRSAATSSAAPASGRPASSSTEESPPPRWLS